MSEVSDVFSNDISHVTRGA